MAITTDNEDGDIDADSDSDEDDDVNDDDSAEESDDGVLYELVDGDDVPDEIVATTKRPWHACISMKNQARDDSRDLSVAYEFHHSSFMVAVSMHHIVPNYLLYLIVHVICVWFYCCICTLIICNYSYVYSMPLYFYILFETTSTILLV